jgi:hypothetical protein
MKCPKCKKGNMRQQVSIYADLPADCFNLCKKGIRSKEVKILGVGWDLGIIYCDEGCGNFINLRKKRK